MNTSQRSFSSGELAPALHARSDLAQYARGLKLCENAYVMRTGGLQSRPGTVYKGTMGSAVRIVECVFDDDQNYLLEFGNLYLRFWRDGSRVTATGPTWLTATAYTLGQVVEHTAIADQYYVCIAAHTSGASTNPGTGGSWATVWKALTPITADLGAPAIYEIPTPYGSAILRELQFVATVGELRIAHNTVAMEKLVRVAETEWLFEEVVSEPSLGAPTLATNATGSGAVSWVVTAFRLSDGVESLASNIVTGDTTPAPASIFTQTWGAVTGATTYRVYKSLAGSVFGFVTELSGLSWADGGDAPVYTVNPPEQGAEFSSAGTYPGVIGAFQQRIFISGSVDAPDFVRGSRSDAIDDYTRSSPIVDSDMVSWRMVGSRVIRPRHFLEVGERLWQFTNVGEGPVEGNEAGSITPFGINPRILSRVGAAKYPAPVAVTDGAIFVQARGGAVWELLRDGTPSELSVTSAHLVDGYTLVEACYQQTPHSIVWFVRSDGVLLSLTRHQGTGVLGWARHTTDGTVESIACVEEGTEDAVYLVVNRTIDGNTVRYLERMHDRTLGIEALVSMDAAVVYTPGGATTSPVGTLDGILAHLEGKSVSVVGILNGVATVLASPNNTAQYPTTYTVSGGHQITGAALAGYTTLIIGLPFTVTLQTLDIDTVGGKSRKDAGYNLTRLGAWLEDSRDFFAGPLLPSTAHDVTTLQRIGMRDADDNVVTTPFSGYCEGALDGLWQQSGSMVIRHVDPTPLTLLAIIPFGSAGRS